MKESVFLVLIILFGIVITQDCNWNKDTDFPTNYPPLLINNSTWISLKPIDDNGQRMVKVTEGTVVVVACTGTLITSLGVEVTEGVCQAGGLAISNGNDPPAATIYTIMDLACTDRIDDATLHTNQTCGYQDIGSVSYIGFNVPGYQFYPTILICFDDDLDITLYAQDIIYGEYNSAKDSNPDRPAFQDDDQFYQTYDPNDCYLTANQDQYATDTLGNASLIDLNGGIYFSRGHLAPNADFFTEMEADASFYFCNAMPQWQPYNGGNWEYLEIDTRYYAEDHSSNLIITTGPWGNLVANDINGTPLNIFICDDLSIHKIPIPESVWKVIYEPSSNNAVTVITSNIPYQSVIPVEVCPSFDCETMGWLDIDEQNLEKGYTYCCTIQDFHAVNPNAPDYPDAGILIE